MSLKYSLTFALLSFACVAAAAGLWDRIGWFIAPLAWTGISFAMLAVAYGGAGPGLLLKRPSGRRSILGSALYGPYLILSATSFALYRRTTRESAYVEVMPDVFFGRRLTPRECAAGGWVSVLDLAVEFDEARPFRELAGYRSMPVLDATAPTAEQLRAAVDWIIASALKGPVYVHCALGHSRSACVIVAYLLAIGAVETIGVGMRQLRGLRPGVGLSPVQRTALSAFEPRFR